MSGTASAAGPDEAAILAHFGLGPNALLGAGGEARVFALDDERVLRVGGTFAESAEFARLRVLWDRFASVDIGVLTPLVFEVGRVGGQCYTIDQRIPGESLDQWLRRDQPDRLRRRVLLDYLDVAERLHRLPIDDGDFRVLAVPDRVPSGASLVDLLVTQAELGLSHSDGLLAAAVPDLDHEKAALWNELSTREVQPAFVHGDYFPGNVMVDGDHISGVIDISVHSLAADPVMNPVAAACMCDLISYPQAADDAVWLLDELTERLAGESWLITAYRRWYALYYSMDHGIIDWAARQFTEE